jgi:ABC-type glycerol-3-phosphate transport system permease component
MSKNSLTKGSLFSRIMIPLGTVILLVWVGFPFYWLIITSLKSPAELFLTPPSWFPKFPFNADMGFQLSSPSHSRVAYTWHLDRVTTKSNQKAPPYTLSIMLPDR